MTLQYKLTVYDFLQYLLFEASCSNRSKRRRRKSWLQNAFAFLSLGFLFYFNGNTLTARALAYYFLICGVLAFFFYPLYQRSHYKRYYLNFITETYQARIGQTCNLSILDDIIEIKDFTGEHKINWSALENVTETGEYFYLKMKTPGHLIIPKSRVDNSSDLKVYLQQLCDKHSIQCIENINWRWK